MRVCDNCRDDTTVSTVIINIEREFCIDCKVAVTDMNWSVLSKRGAGKPKPKRRPPAPELPAEPPTEQSFDGLAQGIEPNDPDPVGSMTVDEFSHYRIP